MEEIDPRRLERLHQMAFPHSAADALRHATEHEAVGGYCNEGVADRQVLERQRARLVWEALERAQVYLAPSHPAELHIRRALVAAEDYWRGLAAAAPEPGANTLLEQRGKAQARH